MRIEKKITDSKNYGDKRKTSDIQYIVVMSLGDKPTPHYHIADGKAYQIVPDSNLSKSVNGAKMNRRGIYHGICTTYNSISIGMVDNPSQEDTEMCLRLMMTIMQRYNIPYNKVIRKRDVTGEINPEIWDDDNKWKLKVMERLKKKLDMNEQ